MRVSVFCNTVAFCLALIIVVIAAGNTYKGYKKFYSPCKKGYSPCNKDYKKGCCKDGDVDVYESAHNVNWNRILFRHHKLATDKPEKKCEIDPTTLSKCTTPDDTTLHYKTDDTSKYYTLVDGCPEPETCPEDTPVFDPVACACLLCTGQSLTCGKRVPAPEGPNQIIGGTDATLNQYPWLVNWGVQGRLWCGGTVISEDYVLTAAHCFFPNMPVAVDVTFGDQTLSVADAGQYSMTVPAADITLHPNYLDDGSFDYDYALMRLPNSLTFDHRVQPACLPCPCPEGEPEQECQPDTEAEIAGWGSVTVYAGPPVDTLQHATVRIHDRPACQAINAQLTLQMMCAGENGIGICSGDSGGPLLSETDTRATVCGVNSYVWGPVGNPVCGNPQANSFLAKVCVPHVLDWIKTTAEM